LSLDGEVRLRYGVVPEKEFGNFNLYYLLVDVWIRPDRNLANIDITLGISQECYTALKGGNRYKNVIVLAPLSPPSLRRHNPNHSKIEPDAASCER